MSEGGNCGDGGVYGGIVLFYFIYMIRCVCVGGVGGYVCEWRGIKCYYFICIVRYVYVWVGGWGYLSVNRWG